MGRNGWQMLVFDWLHRKGITIKLGPACRLLFDVDGGLWAYIAIGHTSGV
jgi:hypothetical protein